MALPSSFKTLTKTDRRKQWKELKARHAKAIAKAKVNFDEKLGPALDKYQTQVDKLTRLAATTQLNSNQIQPVLDTVKPLQTITTSYHDKVKTLDDPAKKELAALLAAIEADGRSWGQLAVSLMSAPSKGPTPAQKTAVSALVNPLDSLHSQTLSLATRGERARTAFKNNKPKARMGSAALAGNVVAAAKLAGASAHELANLAAQVSAGSNYELFKTRAHALLVQVQSLRQALQAFEAKWDMNLDAAESTITSEVDAASLHGSYHQAIGLCDAVIKGIALLP